MTFATTDSFEAEKEELKEIKEDYGKTLSNAKFLISKVFLKLLFRRQQK